MIALRKTLVLACLTTLVLAAVLLTYITSSCGSSKSGIPPYKVSPFFEAHVYLAPDSTPELPTRLRLLLGVSESSLPLSNVSFDPDRDDGVPSASVGFHRIGQDSPDEKVVNFYFDFQWEGPDETMAEVTIVCAAGTHSDNVWLQLDQLQPWPY